MQLFANLCAMVNDGGGSISFFFVRELDGDSFFFFNGDFDRGALFVFLFGAVKIMTDFAIALPVVLVAIT